MSFRRSKVCKCGAVRFVSLLLIDGRGVFYVIFSGFSDLQSNLSKYSDFEAYSQSLDVTGFLGIWYPRSGFPENHPVCHHIISVGDHLYMLILTIFRWDYLYKYFTKIYQINYLENQHIMEKRNMLSKYG